MKKLFLVGAIVASMAFSSSALAAVSYGNGENAKVSYDATNGTVSVTTDLSSYSGQMTVIVLNNDDGTIAQEEIMYIDQTAAGANIFQNMGLKTAIPAGSTYTVKIGGANVPGLITETITVAADGTDWTFVYGDVDGTDTVAVEDVSAIIAHLIGSGSAAGGDYDIAATITKADDSTMVYGDVDGTDTVAIEDVSAIIAHLIGSGSAAGGDYDIGTTNTIKIK